MKVRKFLKSLCLSSCWAFAIVSVIESFFAIQGNKLTSFSEQQLVDCSNKDNGCTGGNHYTGKLSYNKIFVLFSTVYFIYYCR